MVITCPPHILEAYKNGDFTDFIISCGGLDFAVHSVVVGSACEFLAKSLKFTGKEAEERRINLDDDDPEMIRRLVAYLYLGDYDPCNEVSIKAFDTIKQYATTTMPAPERHPRKTMFATSQALDECACLAPRKVNSEHQQNKASAYSTVGMLKDSVQVEEPLTIHATMYALADKYQVAGLSDLARDKFEKTLYHHSNSEDFVNAVEIAYTGTPESNRGLRLAVLRAFRICFQVDVTEIPGFEAKLETIDQLSFLLIKSWPTKTEPARSVNPVLPNSTAHSSSTPTTGSGLFANIPSRTPSGFGSSTPVLNTAGNAQTSQANGVTFGRLGFSTNTR